RDGHVTEVQTCALPISHAWPLIRLTHGAGRRISGQACAAGFHHCQFLSAHARPWVSPGGPEGKVIASSNKINDLLRWPLPRQPRSEERRVGKVCRSR